MNNKLKEIFEKTKLEINKSFPSLYEETPFCLWTDEHISKMMLEAHLDKDLEAASRKYAFIEKSVAWIKKEFYQDKNENTLLDLGCGPGLYTNLFSLNGFKVTGIDFSSRSIDYAINKAKKDNLSINYLCDDYLNISYKNQFDVCTLIYCDFGVLSDIKRKILLKKIYDGLKNNGVFICDGWTLKEKENFLKEDTYYEEYFEHGFFSEKPYYLIERHKLYETNNYLEQYNVIQSDGNRVFNTWNKFYTKETFVKEFTEAGFNKDDICFYDDVSGSIYTGKVNTICAVVKKRI